MEKKTILLIGAGKSATVLIQYLLQFAKRNEIRFMIADVDLDVLKQKLGKELDHVTPIGINITDKDKREEIITQSDIVISMMPPTLHLDIARDCIRLKKHLLTASYAGNDMKLLHDEAVEAGVLMLCEMGLDPGIDHMSAMQLIHHLQERGAQITSFKSHCGGLIAPESDDNPWHYKISWNPRNVVLAGKDGAVYLDHGKHITQSYSSLFDAPPEVEVEGATFACYANRNSLPYIDLYGLQNVETFVRTTLRHPHFMEGWKHIVALGLTDETPRYETDQLSLAAFFALFFTQSNQTNWLMEKMAENISEARKAMDDVVATLNDLDEQDGEGNDTFIEVEADGTLKESNKEEKVSLLAEKVKEKMQSGNRLMKQFIYLGLNDEKTIINKGLASAADVIQFALEKKLALQPTDKDMIVMQHEIDYVLQGEQHQVRSNLVVKGEDSQRTAMAKTVGLPLGIAAILLSRDHWQLKGVHLPVLSEIYEPVLHALAEHGIVFKEELI